MVQHFFFDRHVVQHFATEPQGYLVLISKSYIIYILTYERPHFQIPPKISKISGPDLTLRLGIETLREIMSYFAFHCIIGNYVVLFLFRDFLLCYRTVVLHVVNTNNTKKHMKCSNGKHFKGLKMPYDQNIGVVSVSVLLRSCAVLIPLFMVHGCNQLTFSLSPLRVHIWCVFSYTSGPPFLLVSSFLTSICTCYFFIFKLLSLLVSS